MVDRDYQNKIMEEMCHQLGLTYEDTNQSDCMKFFHAVQDQLIKNAAERVAMIVEKGGFDE